MVALGSDHGGFALKEAVKAHFEKNKIAYKDYGCYGEESVDYPDMAAGPCAAVVQGECDNAILFCGTGIGIGIAANKIPGIRACMCSDHYSARYTRLHNNANVLCLGGRVVGAGTAIELVDIFLSTPFEGGRHSLRVEKINKLDIKQEQ